MVFSAFNSGAIKDVKIIKDKCLSEYDGRLSSVIDNKMKEDNIRNFNVSNGLAMAEVHNTSVIYEIKIQLGIFSSKE